MSFTLQRAAARDVPELVLFRKGVNRDLANRFGDGFWVARSTEKGALAAMKHGSVFIARLRGRIIASLTLSMRRPRAIDARCFSASTRPLYLTSMAVDPRHHGKGLGRLCMEEARRIAIQACRCDSARRMGCSRRRRRLLPQVRLSQGRPRVLAQDAAHLL